jgi:hypothetical protein
MSTHQFVYETFVIYLFVKSLVFAPLLWLAFMYWWSKRQIPSEPSNTTLNDQVLIQPHLLPDAELQEKQAA